MTVPQIVRTLRDRSLPGVSALSWAMTALACTTWMLYGFRSGELPQIPGNVLLVTGAVIIVFAVPSTASVPLRALGLTAPAALLGVLAASAPPAAIGFVAFGIGLVSAAPQAARSLSRRDTSGS